MVVADAGRIDCARLGRYRAEPWPVFKSDSDDPFDHLRYLWRGEPEIAVPPVTVHRKQAGLCQPPEMCTGSLRSDPRRKGKLVCAHGTAIDIVARVGSPTNAATSAMMAPLIIPSR